MDKCQQSWGTEGACNHVQHTASIAAFTCCHGVHPQRLEHKQQLGWVVAAAPPQKRQEGVCTAAVAMHVDVLLLPPLSAAADIWRPQRAELPSHNDTR